MNEFWYAKKLNEWNICRAWEGGNQRNGEGENWGWGDLSLFHHFAHSPLRPFPPSLY